MLALDDTGAVERLVAEESVALLGANLEPEEVSLFTSAESLGAAVAGKLLSAGAAPLLERMRTRLV